MAQSDTKFLHRSPALKGKLPAGIGLAPMEGVTDFPTRLWFQLCSEPDFVATPFLRVTATFPSKELPLDWAPELLHAGVRDACTRPLRPQLMAPEPDYFLRVAESLLQLSPLVEINCGCPAPTVVGKGAGSGLLAKPGVFADFMGCLRRHMDPDRLSVKMRTGYDSSEHFSELLGTLSALSPAQVVVHGRTRADRYTGEARWDLISAASSALSTPVLGSGDITCAAGFATRLATAPKVSGVMIGRGALRNPWIFAELASGSVQLIPYPALRAALYTFALLQEQNLQDAPRLWQAASEGLFRQPCRSSAEDWEALAAALFKGLSYQALSTGGFYPVSNRALGRLKLLWNYLRSSLPPRFFSPQIFRSLSAEAFFTQLDALALSEEGGSELTLAWLPRHDWIYSGGKKQASASFEGSTS